MDTAPRAPDSPVLVAPPDEVVQVATSPSSSFPRASRDDEFAAFMARHQRDLLRTAWLLCGDAHRAEELTQQALVRTYGAWSRAHLDPLAYARRVLVNLRVDTWRRRRREVLTPPERMPDSAGAPDARPDDRDQLVRALAVLTPRQRRVVVLRHVHDLSEAEVAGELGISVGTVKSTASRALATLRTDMARTDMARTDTARTDTASTDMASGGHRSLTRPGGSDVRTH